MNFYPHHIGDYKAATAHLTDLEDLAYRRLLDMYYDTERPIPVDTQWVSRRLRLDSQTLAAVLSDFFLLTDDGYRHSRCDMEIREYNEKAERSRANGKKGGRRKAPIHEAKNPVGSQQVARPNPEPAQALANQEPGTINQEPVLEPSPKARRKQQLPADFQPNEAGQAAATAKGLGIPAELQKFSDYHRAKGNVMLDWQAAWRTWVGNARASFAQASTETPYQRSMREKYEVIAPTVAARSPGRVDPNSFFDSLPTHPLEITNG